MEEEPVEGISREEIIKALGKMKGGKAVGPDDIPAEVWKYLGDEGISFLQGLFNRIQRTGTMPDVWRCSIVVPI